jgi:acyl-ACP thioesterase
MKFRLDRSLDYFDVDSRFRLKLGTLFRYFQEAAVMHSEKVGGGSRDLVKGGKVWILHKIAAEMIRYPEYGETVTVTTWSRGAKGFKAFRDFAVFAGDRRLAAATSVWLYFDMERKRILRVPEDLMAAYSVEDEAALDPDLDAWRPDTEFEPEAHVEITTRSSDFDPLGHVNNSLYFDYLETMAARVFPVNGRIGKLKIQFQKEIGAGCQVVRAGGLNADDGCRFKVFSQDQVHAAGVLEFQGR